MYLLGKEKHACRELVTWRERVKEEQSLAKVSRRRSAGVQSSPSGFAIKGSLTETGCLNNLPKSQWVVDDTLA